MIFVFSAVRDQSGHSFVVTATDTIHRGIEAYNKADLSVCDYGEVKVYNSDGIWVNSMKLKLITSMQKSRRNFLVITLLVYKRCMMNKSMKPVDIKQN
ncbi:hypothetical protein vBKpnAMK4_00293 [Klebsiella phage vB_Kpn_AM_K4]